MIFVKPLTPPNDVIRYEWKIILSVMSLLTLDDVSNTYQCNIDHLLLPKVTFHRAHHKEHITKLYLVIITQVKHTIGLTLATSLLLE